MEYLGVPGRLLGLACASSERLDTAARYAQEFTVEGARRVQARPVTPRTWDVSVGVTTPSELAPLVEFASGAWGNGPFEWVPIQAQRGNLLTPRESVLLDRASVSTVYVQDAGPVLGADGLWAARSVTVTLTSGWVALARGVPVLAGEPFTFSCDVDGTSPQVHVRFVDAAGATISDHEQAGTGAGMQRVSLTVPPPVGAVTAQVGVRSTVTRATRPQASWTDGPVPFSTGHGCRSAVVDGFSESLLMANRFGTYSDISFNVLELS